MRSVECPMTHSFGLYAAPASADKITLEKAQSLLSCGTGQADSQIIQTTDGKPLIKDGRLYLCLTTRGFEQIPDSYQGVYSLDISSFELRLEGALFFGKSDGIIYGFHATKVVYDAENEEFLVITTSHGDTHTLVYASTKANLLHGIHYLECKELDFPHNYTRGNEIETKYNTEDPDFFYDKENDRWLMAICRRDPAIKNYRYFFYESDSPFEGYEYLGKGSDGAETGGSFVKVCGEQYFLCGNDLSSCICCNENQ